MGTHAGGCLCGALGFEVTADPLWITACFCRFCQRATGSTGVIEPIFDATAFRITKGTPARYVHVSDGSGKEVHVHFCQTCATKTHLTFERWPDRLGVYSGAFDDPGWFDFTPANSKYIFLDEAPRGTMVPAGFTCFFQHAATPDGTPQEPFVPDEVWIAPRRT
ncbi:GFA family protein [Maliponia aquimaris]|uniref:Glutathione-dependent formaldehyde-activating enzyme n=1 Tax=Maliponia aquimaris TaxID=1673631 RepID=A0A238K8Z5_9RHOB|nr:GFA family protein [Maliponia aquimaris]SMX38904.1 Glutathione-dependent formaldehyde-activating enzyme [Maliponia aquimaris]